MVSDDVKPVRTVDLAELVGIAAKATQDELEWADDGEGLVLQGVHTGQIVFYAHDSPDDEVAVVVSESDRALIAAASAPVVTALVARIEELHQALMHACGLLDPPEHDSDIGLRWAADEFHALLAKGVVLP